jgi:hypothetical protein
VGAVFNRDLLGQHILINEVSYKVSATEIDPLCRSCL